MRPIILKSANRQRVGHKKCSLPLYLPRVRFRILSSSSGTSPASPASSASAPAKDADDASVAGDVAHAGEGNEGGKGGKDLNSERGGRSQGGKGEDLGKKCLKGEREEKIFGRKREIFLGGNRP